MVVVRVLRPTSPVNNEDVLTEEGPTEFVRWENVAWNKPASQSSTYNNFYQAGWAVDGYPDATDTG